MRHGGTILAGAALLACFPLALAHADLDAVVGKALFERVWVQAPATTDAADGLGPLFNERSCASCHRGGGGASFARSTEGAWSVRGVAVRLGDADGHGDPVFGRQLQTHAVAGLKPEGALRFSDAAGVPEPAITIDGKLATATRLSVRQAPSLFGRTAFDQATDASILAHADPDDRDGDGISGRPNLITRNGGTAIGRYGWKAETADLPEQIAHAFALDIGLSSPGAPRPHGDCTVAETDCMGAPTGESAGFGGRELSAEMVGLVAAFVRSLPDGADAAASSAAGAKLFTAAGCGACHVPALADAAGHPVRTYSDLLLHNMGPGLDDAVGEPGVASAEWRTAPLIGLANGGSARRYLHDGRADGVDAAIRAHGGEAAGAVARYGTLDDDDRRLLTEYLETL